MSEEIAIKVENVSKNFKLPHEKHSSLKSKIVHSFSKTKGFQTQHALKDVSFEVKKGEFFGIVGRNGSGKSTLLKMLAGIYQPSQGKISVQGKLVPFIELGVGFNPELTGRENVFLNGALLGFTNTEVAKMYDEIVEFAELEKFMDQKLKNYSSGMQVRLAFSMAVRAKADILLIDEVLAVGDADFQRKCYEYFKKLKITDMTVVFVTHEMGAIKEYCDRAMLIDEARIVDIGSPEVVSVKYTKMFANNVQYSNKSQGGKLRNGDMLATFDNLKIQPSSIDDLTKHMVIDADIKVIEDLESILVGFKIKDDHNKSLIGTNNQILRKKIMNLKKGDCLNLVWKIPNVLPNGEYSLDLSIEDEYGIETHDWWEEASKIVVKKRISNPNPIDPEIELSLRPNLK